MGQQANLPKQGKFSATEGSIQNSTAPRQFLVEELTK
jgi:hypothetical protein